MNVNVQSPLEATPTSQTGGRYGRRRKKIKSHELHNHRMDARDYRVSPVSLQMKKIVCTCEYRQSQKEKTWHIVGRVFISCLRQELIRWFVYVRSLRFLSLRGVSSGLIHLFNMSTAVFVDITFIQDIIVIPYTPA